MANTTEKTTIKTVEVKKNTWILELPSEICEREGFADGTLASLTIRDGAIEGSFIRPGADAKRLAERFIKKYDRFMKDMDPIDG